MSSVGAKGVETNGKWGVHVLPDEGRRLWTVGDTYTLKAKAENTGGAPF